MSRRNEFVHAPSGSWCWCGHRHGKLGLFMRRPLECSVVFFALLGFLAYELMSSDLWLVLTAAAIVVVVKTRQARINYVARKLAADREQALADGMPWIESDGTVTGPKTAELEGKPDADR